MNRGRVITKRLLVTMPLPEHDDDDDKNSRGCVLVVGGSSQLAGAVELSGVAALRAGAGKLQLATVASAGSALSIAVPEALVVSLPAGKGGEIAASRCTMLKKFAARCDALLIGPGMTDANAARTLI